MRKDKEKKVKGYENGSPDSSNPSHPGHEGDYGNEGPNLPGHGDAAEFFGLLFSEVRESTAELGVLEADLVICNSGGG